MSAIEVVEMNYTWRVKKGSVEVRVWKHQGDGVDILSGHTLTEDLPDLIRCLYEAAGILDIDPTFEMSSNR